MKDLQLPILARKVGMGCVPLKGASVVVTFLEVVTGSRSSHPVNSQSPLYKDSYSSSPTLRQKNIF
jgi:hypothetical protein